MAIPWHSSLPQKPIPFEYDEEEPDNIISHGMQAGPPKTRPTSSAMGEIINWAWVFYANDSIDQKAIFRSFYRTTLAYGSRNFELLHPDTKVLTEFKIMSRPKYKYLGGEYIKLWQCNFTVMVIV